MVLDWKFELDRFRGVNGITFSAEQYGEKGFDHKKIVVIGTEYSGTQFGDPMAPFRVKPNRSELSFPYSQDRSTVRAVGVEYIVPLNDGMGSVRLFPTDLGTINNLLWMDDSGHKIELPTYKPEVKPFMGETDGISRMYMDLVNAHEGAVLFLQQNPSLSYQMGTPIETLEFSIAAMEEHPRLENAVKVMYGAPMANHLKQKNTEMMELFQTQR